MGKKLVSRRQMLAAGVVAPAAGWLAGWSEAVAVPLATDTQVDEAPLVRTDEDKRIVVVGAGAFGGWTALWLRRHGHAVTLIDTWGPGNARASSGGDTRVIRHSYNKRIYVDLVKRSMGLWREHEKRWNELLLHRTGMIWLVQDAGQYEEAAVKHLEAAGISHQVLSAADVVRRWPVISGDGVRWALWEDDAGYLLARRSCESVLKAFLAEGGTYRQAHARPGPIVDGEMQGVLVDGDEPLAAGRIVFACGPWLGRVLPDAVGTNVRATRQEVFTFGTPAQDPSYDQDRLPIWADHGERFWYGIPGSERRGFKVADDTHGEPFDPTHGERLASADGLKRARSFMARRFPGMAQAPVLESRVCQYENSPDTDYIIDRHPEAENAWIVGGGSGHGFKNGPAVGESAAALVLEKEKANPLFSLARLSSS